MITDAIYNTIALHKNDYQKLSHHILAGNSVLVLSTVIPNTSLFVRYLFERHELYEKYLTGTDFRYYPVFIPSGTEDSPHNYDHSVLEYSNRVLGTNYYDVKEIARYLEQTSSKLVFIHECTEDRTLRYLLSYQFILKEHVQFICISRSHYEYFDHSLYFTLSDHELHDLVSTTINGLDVALDPQHVLDDMEGDVTRLFHSILSASRGGSRNVSFENKTTTPNESTITPSILEHFMEATGVEAPTHTDILAEREEEIPVVVQENAEEREEPKTFAFDQIHNEAHEHQTLDKANLPREQQERKDQTLHPRKENLKNSSRNAMSESLQHVPLTARERKIFNELQKEQFLSRSKLARLAWGKDYARKATPDAIDQIISRMRRKFVKEGISNDIITTKKGEGIELNPEVIP